MVKKDSETVYDKVAKLEKEVAMLQTNGRGTRCNA